MRSPVTRMLLLPVALLLGCGEAESTESSGGGTSVAATGNGEDWPQFRGPTGMGVSAAENVPTEWSETENLLWKSEFPGAGTSSPVVYGGKVYLTSYSGYNVPGERGGSQQDLRRQVHQLDLASGKMEWTKEVESKLPEQNRIRDDHGYASNTPAVDESGLFVFFGKSGVHAYDHDGSHRWSRSVGTNLHGWGSAASPIIVGDLLVVNASVESESLVALDKKTGDEVWRATGINEAWNTPVLVEANGRTELAVATHGKIRAFDPETGDALWNCDTSITWYMVPGLVAADGVVYAIGGRSGTAALAVRAGGKGDVTKTHRLWTSTNGSNVSSPILHDGHLYWMHEKQGIAYCAKAATGEVVYQERVDRAGQIYTAAVLANGKLFYVNRQGRTFVVAAKPEFELLATNDLADGTLFHASPAAVDGKLLLRSNKAVYCLGEE